MDRTLLGELLFPFRLRFLLRGVVLPPGSTTADFVFLIFNSMVVRALSPHL